MVQGIETAAAGMVSIIDRNDIIANNLANTNTVGFKQLMPSFKNIHDVDVQVKNIDDPASPGMKKIGTLSAGCALDATQLDFAQGALKQTGRSLDVALDGEGFFRVKNDSGEYYTRNGSFSLNEEGDLITRSGDLVLNNSGGTINIDITGRSMEDVTITKDGRIMHNDAELDRLGIVDFADKTKLKMKGHSLFENIDPKVKPVEPENYSVSQGFLEGSNANVIKSMINSVEGSRIYETLSKVIRDSDQTLRKTVNEVGDVR